MRTLRNNLFAINLLFFFSLAITTYINSSYIESQVGEGFVGILYAISALITVLIHMRATHALSRMGNRLFFFLYAFIQVLSLILLVIPGTDLMHMVGFVMYLSTSNILIFSLDVFFQRVAGEKDRGKNRGIFLLLGNAGYVLAPLLTANLVDKFGYAGSYVCALMILVGIIVLVFVKMQDYRDAKYSAHPAHVVIHKAIRNKSIRYVLVANFLLQFFYAWMIVYSPILLHTHLGLAWDTIGIIFAVMLTTFVILDYPLGRLADYIGSEKELTVIGFGLMALAVFGLAFLPLTSVLLIGLLFFVSRIGAATVEAMTEIHFFKIIKETDSGMLSLFRDMRPFAYIVAPILGALLLPFAPLKILFAVLGIIMIAGSYISFKIEKDKRWWSRAHTK